MEQVNKKYYSISCLEFLPRLPLMMHYNLHEEINSFFPKLFWSWWFVTAIHKKTVSITQLKESSRQIYANYKESRSFGCSLSLLTQQQVSYSAYMKGSNAFWKCNLLIACQMLFELTEKLTMEAPPTSYPNMFVSKYISKISCTESCWSPASDNGGGEAA